MLNKGIFRLVEMSFGLVPASYSLPKWQSVKLTFIAPGDDGDDDYDYILAHVKFKILNWP